MTTIKAKSNMYNGGKCFTKGRTYQVNQYVSQESSLMDCITINDLGEPHVIGVFWRNFIIVR